MPGEAHLYIDKTWMKSKKIEKVYDQWWIINNGLSCRYDYRYNALYLRIDLLQRTVVLTPEKLKIYGWEDGNPLLYMKEWGM